MRIVAITAEREEVIVINYEDVSLMYVDPGIPEAGLWPTIYCEMVTDRVLHLGPFASVVKASEMIGMILSAYRTGQAVITMEI